MLTSASRAYARAQERGERPPVFSAFMRTSPEHIFVEAYADAHVRAFIMGIDGLWGFRPGSIKMVPVAQVRVYSL